MIDNALDGRPKYNHKAIKERIKRIVNNLVIKTYELFKCQNKIEYLHRIFIF